MATIQELTAVVQQMQQQMAQLAQENAGLRDRVQAAEQQTAGAGGGSGGSAEVLQALSRLPEVLEKMSKRGGGGLIDQKGLGKPQVLGEGAEDRFRVWALKLEDYVAGVIGGKSREVLEWAAEQENPIAQMDIDNQFGAGADLLDQWDEVDEMNQQVYTILRATTEGAVFDLVENAPKGAGLEAWRALHRKFDPSTGGRKRIMLQALTSPERSSYENLGNALERWKALRNRYDRKKDQFGKREVLQDSLAMNALEKLVPKEMEQHLMLNYTRFRTFEEMEQEVVTYMEAKTGSKLTISKDFSKSSAGDVAPMDVDSLVRAVNGNLASLVKGKKGGGKGGKAKFEGNCDNCGKKGHKKKDCWSKPQQGSKGGGAKSRSNSQSAGKGKFDGICNNCGKKGHMKKDCWAKGGGASSSSAPTSPKGGKGGKREAASLEQPGDEPEGEANGLDLCALSSTARVSTTTSFAKRVAIKRRELGGEINLLKCNFDTGASVTAIPKRYKREGTGGGKGTFKTASGELINNYGPVKIGGYDMNGVKRMVNGNATDVHKVLISAGRLHGKGHSTWLWKGGGTIMPVEHPVYKTLEEAYEKALELYGDKGMIPVVEENGIYNFYLEMPDPESADEQVAELETQASASGLMKSKPKAKAARIDEERNTVWALEDEIGDQQEGPEELVEARPAHPGWVPPQPSERERKEHEASGHAVYRSWCEMCVKAAGLVQKHVKVDHGDENPDMSTVSLDYFYMGEAEGAKPNIVARDRKTGLMTATSMERKGLVDATAQKMLTRFLESLGYKEVVLKSDGERSLVKMKMEAAKKARGLKKAVPEESPAGDSRSNGEAEAAVKEIKWRCKANLLALDKKLEGGVPEGHPITYWAPRYSAEQHGRFKVGADGRTPEERRTGKRWVKAMPEFGEKIMVKPAGGGKRGDWARMVSGRYLGTHNRFGSILAMTDAGVVVGTGFHTVPEDQRWSRLEPGLRGVPWDIKKYVNPQPEERQQQQQKEGEDQRLPPVVLVAPAPGPGGEVPVERPEEHQGGEAPEEEGHSAKGRAWPVRRTMMQKYGSTPGCQGCHTINTGGALVQASHSEECRARMKRRIAEDVKKDEEKMKKQKDEDERESARRAKKRAAEEEANDEARAEAEPSSSSRGPDAGEASPKRKGGEQGARDIEDVLRDMEEEASGQAGSRRMEAEEILAEAGSKEAASIVASLGALDVLEVFSPQRVTKELKRFGMRDGAAVDLEEMKPDGSERWNLDRPEDQKEVLEMIQVEEPWLLTSSPPCTTFSPLRNVSNGKRDPGVVQEEEELGKARMRTAMKCCKQQREQGAFYLHEHPKPSTSWKMPEVEEEVNRDDTYLVQSPMCRWGMKMEDREGEILHVRKETLWLTNSRRIAEELEGVCENVLQGREVHRHVHLVGGGRAKAAQVYPKELVEAILRGLRKELRERGEISAVEEQLSGPTPDEYVEQEELYKEEFGQFVDDVTGTELPAHLVKAARKEELGWLHKEGVYVKVPRRICEGKGMKPLQLKWLDINKGDATQVKVRSRLVAKEVRKAKRPEDRLRAEETFAATPPLEAVNLLLSLFMTENPEEPDAKVACWDISRAHFMGRAERELYVELPEEDQCGDDGEESPEPMVGLLRRSMYGTQDASKVFQGDYIGWLKEHGAEFCALCPAIFKIAERRLIGLVHGDDFMVKGNGANLQWLDGVLNTRYTARLEAMLGRGAEDDKEMLFLNRKIRFKLDDAARWKLELEADARHAEIVMRYFGFNEKTKGVDIPEEKMRDAERVAEERLPELDAEQAVDYRSMVMRLAYLSQDRPDLGHAVKVLSSAMRSPKQGDMQRLKRVARYLVKVPYLKKIFKQQPMREMEVRAWSDSDWAGDPLTRKSVTGAVIKNGGHTLMVRGVTQKIVALSSCESEYYGMCRTATLAEFVRNVMAFYMGEKVPVVKMLVDSSAAKAMTERRGVGKTRHVQARYLWLQDRVAEKALRVEKTPGAVNDADVVTKVLSGGVMRGHLTRMGFEASDNKGHKALFF